MIITSKTPKLDLHGEISSMVKVIVDDFINEHFILKDVCVVIIHGKSTNILTKEVHKVLKESKKVECFKLDNNNLGQTIVKLKV